jgi:YD repeat-containing protein
MSRWLVVALAAQGCSHKSGGVIAVDARSDAPIITTSDRCVVESFNASAVVDERATQGYDGDRIVSTEWAEPLSNDALTWTYQYDAQGRPVAAHLDAIGTADLAATYSTDQVVVGRTPGPSTYVYTLHAGKVMHSEGPMEQPVDVRDVQDATYDGSGRLATLTRSSVEIGPAAASTTTAWTYDAQGRVAQITRTAGPTASFTYTLTAGGWSVRRDLPGLATESAAFLVDARGRLVRASIDEDGDGHEDWFATYTYDDAASTIDVVDTRPQNGTPGRHWLMQGRCAAPAITSVPTDIVPLTVPQAGLYEPVPGFDLYAY